MLSINTNIPSIVAQRSLNNSTKLLNQAIERMTTGFKINHASDNAANYSIVTNMGVKLSSYAVAEDNVAAGLDLLSTAIGSLDLISDKLTRLRALAEQSSNGTYGEQSLRAINSEANSIVDEIERIYSTAEYNGIKLFGTSGGSFIEEVQQRDTSSMTKLSSVSTTQTISSGTYSISTAEELAQLATMTNSGKVTGGEFVLSNNIDLSAYSSGEGWTPIGNYSNNFSGAFDGNGYVVSNLYINRPTEDYQGLFGYADHAEIKNLGVENANVTGANCTGSFGGNISFSTVKNIYSVANVEGNYEVGGLIGHFYNSDMTICYSSGNVVGNNNDVGGLSGWVGNSMNITDIASTCNVSGKCDVGGLTGSVHNSAIAYSYATGNVTGTTDVSGLTCSLHSSSIAYCYSTGSVTGGTPIGGLVSGAYGGSSPQSRIKESYYNKDTSGQSDTGKGVGVSTSELTNLIANGTLPNFMPQTAELPNETTFQVGIDSGSSSQITLNTAFELKVSSLRGIGKGGNFLPEIDSLINKISAKQTDFGAIENRLESALEEISTQYDNLVSSRSTLRDADIAEVSSDYIRQQILQQASATLMATANQSPALALQLL